MQLIRRYWRGEISLALSVVLVFVLFSVFYHITQPLVLASLKADVKLYSAATIAWVVVTCLVIFPWQVIGLLRALDRHFLRFDNNLVLYTVQGLVVTGTILTVSMAISDIQSLVYYQEKVAFENREQKAGYQLRVSDNGKRLHLSGALEFGITRAVAETLEQHPQISAVVLDSSGGQIYEGRGLAQEIQKRTLDTYTYSICSSSCTTAFISGHKRFIGQDAKLGFHAYAIDKSRRDQTTQVYDIEKEQLKDLEFFRSQGIGDAFLQRIFDAPGHAMWYPDNELLLSSNVIQAVVE